MKLSDLIGQEIKAEDPIEKTTKKHKYIVVAAYPYYVRGVRICDNGTQITQCFSIGDLVAMGYIRAQMVPHTQGYRFARKGYQGKI